MYYSYAENSIPSQFSVKFTSFSKNFTVDFVRMKRDNQYPIASNDIYVLDKNRNPTKYQLEDDEVSDIKIIRSKIFKFSNIYFRNMK